MTKYTRRDKQRLAPEIIAKFHDAGQRGDLEAFKRLLAEYGAHLPRPVKDELIEEFKRNADALRRALREKK
jgi:hypothetical protein